MHNYFVIKGGIEGVIERFIDGLMAYSSDYSCDTGGIVNFRRVKTPEEGYFDEDEAREEVKAHADYWRT